MPVKCQKSSRILVIFLKSEQSLENMYVDQNLTSNSSSNIRKNIYTLFHSYMRKFHWSKRNLTGIASTIGTDGLTAESASKAIIYWLGRLGVPLISVCCFGCFMWIKTVKHRNAYFLMYEGIYYNLMVYQWRITFHIVFIYLDCKS